MAAAHLEIQGAAFRCMVALAIPPWMSCTPLVRLAPRCRTGLKVGFACITSAVFAAVSLSVSLSVCLSVCH
jgi:hypothetical protein